MTDDEERRIQRERYAAIAPVYAQVHADIEHVLAAAFLEGVIRHLNATSVLDVGAGTGRTMVFLQQSLPHARIIGVEPVEELRKQGHEKGIRETDLVDGDGYALPFADGEFDVVCEFGMLHHVRMPNQVVAEMLRVARQAVFLSDSNNFGGGSWPARFVKQCLHQVGLWPAVNFIKTGGKGYSITRGDGLFYSYSVFDSVPLLKRSCDVRLLNTNTSGNNLYRSASHLAVLALKRQLDDVR